MINFKILSAYKETLNNNLSEQSKSKYLSLPNLQFKLGESSYIIGYHRPISIFQQCATADPLKVIFVFSPIFYIVDLAVLMPKSTNGTGSYERPN